MVPKAFSGQAAEMVTKLIIIIIIIIVVIIGSQVTDFFSSISLLVAKLIKEG